MTTPEIVHACPPVGQEVTTCCGRTPFDLPRTDRLTNDSADVTCGSAIRTATGQDAITPSDPAAYDRWVRCLHGDCPDDCQNGGDTTVPAVGEQQLVEQLAAAIRANSSRVDDVDLAGAVLPVVRAALDVEYRRALTVAADLLSAQEMDDAAAVVRYLSTPYTVDTTTKEN